MRKESLAILVMHRDRSVKILNRDAGATFSNDIHENRVRGNHGKRNNNELIGIMWWFWRRQQRSVCFSFSGSTDKHGGVMVFRRLAELSAVFCAHSESQDSK